VSFIVGVAIDFAPGILLVGQDLEGVGLFYVGYANAKRPHPSARPATIGRRMGRWEQQAGLEPVLIVQIGMSW
jgi:hypothetical protein